MILRDFLYLDRALVRTFLAEARGGRIRRGHAAREDSRKGRSRTASWCFNNWCVCRKEQGKRSGI